MQGWVGREMGMGMGMSTRAWACTPPRTARRGPALGKHAGQKGGGAASVAEEHKPRLALRCLQNCVEVRRCATQRRSAPPRRQRRCTHIRLCSRLCCSMEMA
jgi:hypothetical protein